MSAVLIYLNMVHTGHAEPSGHSDCDMITQSFKNSQKTVLWCTLVVDLCMKNGFARREHTWNLLSDLRTS